MKGIRCSRSAIVVGIGVAGLLDGVVFHQLLEWHHMLTGWHPPDTASNRRLNTVADGWFDLAALAVLLVGVMLLARDVRRVGQRPPARETTGAVLLGAAGFNVVEGLVDHQLLGIHHVHEGPSAGVYDAVFLAASLALCLAGLLMLRSRPTRGSGISRA